MRLPQLYDFVYLGAYGKSLFQVIGIIHYPNEKNATYTLWNIKTKIDTIFHCPIVSDISNIYGIPFNDIQCHFKKGKVWDFVYADVFFNKYDYINMLDFYSFVIKDDKWEYQIEDALIDAEHLHDLQQYYRGITGGELQLINK